MTSSIDEILVKLLTQPELAKMEREQLRVRLAEWNRTRNSTINKITMGLAPVDASYVMAEDEAHTGLTQYRKANAGNLMGITDGGARGNLTLDVHLHHIYLLKEVLHNGTGFVTQGSTTEYPASCDGLVSALAAAGNRDTVILPCCYLNGESTDPVTIWTLPSGVRLVGQGHFASALEGDVILNTNSVLENIYVPSTGHVEVNGVAWMINCVTEDPIVTASDLYAWGCDIEDGVTDPTKAHLMNCHIDSSATAETQGIPDQGERAPYDAMYLMTSDFVDRYYSSGQAGSAIPNHSKLVATLPLLAVKNAAITVKTYTLSLTTGSGLITTSGSLVADLMTPLTFNGNKIWMNAAGSGTDGYLTSVDWNTFNNKFGPTNGSALAFVDRANTFNVGTQIFNESGDANSDFRVEGDTDTNLLFIDASEDAIGIGTNSTIGKLRVIKTFTNLVDVSGALNTITALATFSPSTTSSAEVRGAQFQALSSGSPAMTGALTGVFGQVRHNGTGLLKRAQGLDFQVQNQTGGSITNAIGVGIEVYTSAGSATNAIGLQPLVDTQGGAIGNGIGIYIPSMTLSGGGTILTAYGIQINNINVATTNYAIQTKAGNVVFNDSHDANTDFRVEGDTDANLLFTDASVDCVGIGDSTPSAKLSVYQSFTNNANLIRNINRLANFTVDSAGTPDTNFGGQIELRLKDATGGGQDAANIDWSFVNAIRATKTSRVDIGAYTSGSPFNYLEVSGSGLESYNVSSLGSELHPNGTFTSGSAGWTTSASGSGTLSYDTSGSNIKTTIVSLPITAIRLYNGTAITVVPGKRYRIQATYIGDSSSGSGITDAQLMAGITSTTYLYGRNSVTPAPTSGSTTLTLDIVAQSANLFISLYNNTTSAAGLYMVWDNVTLKEVIAGDVIARGNMTSGSTVDTGSNYKVGGVNGITATVELAKLTTGGANGTLTVVGGIITGYTAPT